MSSDSKSEEEVKFAEPVVNQRWFGCCTTYDNPKSFKTWKGVPGTCDVLRWKFNFDNEVDNSKIPSEDELDKTLPLSEVNLQKYQEKHPNNELFSNWLGHASVLVHMDGLNIITDPIFSTHASPVPLFCPRYRRPPCKVEDLKNIHVGVISHNHFDHLDSAAVAEISKNNPEMKWFVPSGLRSTVLGYTRNKYMEVIELTWGDNYELMHDGKKFDILCTPAQHWSQRSAFDRNTSLWSGWAIMRPKRKFFYSGDTGFCKEEFEKLGKRHGPFDLAAIPIGCYLPREFMKSQHINPAEAIEIGRLIRAKYIMGIHWGTFEMGSNEGYLQPRDDFYTAATAAKLEKGRAFTLNHGEMWTMPTAREEWSQFPFADSDETTNQTEETTSNLLFNQSNQGSKKKD